MDRQRATPICDALIMHMGRDKLSLHTPGHKSGRLVPERLAGYWSHAVWAWDQTEVGELDNLLYAEGCIRRAEQLAAELYGVPETVFVTQGSTAGLLASFLALVKPGDKVLIPRNAHVSVTNAMTLVGAEPVYLPVAISDNGIVHGVEVETLRACLVDHSDAKAVLLINPSYDGICINLSEAVDMIHRFNVPVIVDEAHGAHLHLHEKLPISAVDTSADIVVQSAHKTLPALTGAAWVHLQNRRVSNEAFRRSLRLVHSTSPSYLIMASLDACRHELALYGSDKLAKLLAKLSSLRKAIQALRHVHEVHVSNGFCSDPTKVLINIPYDSGERWQAVLEHRYGIYSEKREGNVLLFMFSMGDCDMPTNVLADALSYIDNLIERECLEPISISKYLPPLSVTETVMSPREVFFGKKQWIGLEKSTGHVCAQAIMAYPPGIPVVLPGERLSADVIRYCMKLAEMSNDSLSGLINSEEGLQVLVVTS